MLFCLSARLSAYACLFAPGQSDSDGDSDGNQEPSKKRARLSNSAGGGGDEQHRKEKHKAVEQKRREKTKELLSTLQDLLPNLDETNSSALTMNTVLQSAIDYLTQNQGCLNGQGGVSAPDTTGEGDEAFLSVSAEDVVGRVKRRLHARRHRLRG